MDMALDSCESMVPVQSLDPPSASDDVHFVALAELKNTDSITLAMGGVQLMDPSWPSIDTNPLYCTVSPLHPD